MNESKNASSETGETKQSSSFTDEARLGFTVGVLEDLTMDQLAQVTFTEIVFNDGTKIQDMRFTDFITIEAPFTNETKH